MPRCTISASPFHPARPSRSGAHPSIRHSSTVRRLGGAVALAALLIALPAPALAAPAEGSPALSGAVVLDWIQAFLARLGVVAIPMRSVSDGPESLTQRAREVMDPDGVAGYGDSNLGGTAETLVVTRSTDG